MSATRVEAKPSFANDSRAAAKSRSRVGPLVRFVPRPVVPRVPLCVSRTLVDAIPGTVLHGLDDDVDVKIFVTKDRLFSSTTGRCAGMVDTDVNVNDTRDAARSAARRRRPTGPRSRCRLRPTGPRTGCRLRPAGPRAGCSAQAHERQAAIPESNPRP